VRGKNVFHQISGTQAPVAASDRQLNQRGGLRHSSKNMNITKNTRKYKDEKNSIPAARRTERKSDE
jgi:hypothetical protein